MVAPQSARPLRLGAALIVCALLLVPGLAVMPATAQDIGEWDLAVVQGEVEIIQGGVRTWFLANQTTATIRATVYNHEPSEVNDVPVYFWFSDPMWLTAPTIPGICTTVDFQAGQLDPNAQPNPNDPKTIPSVKTVEWLFNVPVGYPVGGYNITVLVNERPTLDEIPATKYSSTFGNACLSNQNGKHGITETVDIEDNNRAVAYFVKDLKPDLRLVTSDGPGIRWCAGTPRVTTDCDTNMEISHHPGVYNRTVHYLRRDPKDPDEYILNENLQPTYLQVNVTTAGTLRDTTDYGSAGCAGKTRGCHGFPYTVRVTARGFNLTGETDITWAGQKARGDDWHTVGALPLRGLAGNYTINVTLDPPVTGRPNGNVTEANAAGTGETNNQGERKVEVQWVDFEAKIHAADFRTNASDPYPYTTEFLIRGNVTFRNLGPAPLLHPEGFWDGSTTSPHNATVRYRLYIEDAGPRFSISRISNATNGAEGLNFKQDRIDTLSYSWFATSTPGNPGFIRPGKHKLIAEIDTDDYSLEPNKTNNKHEVEIYIQDTTEPQFVDLPMLNPPDTNGVNLTARRPAEPFYVRVNVSDDDLSSVKVVANFTLAGNASVNRTIPLRQSTTSPKTFEALVSDFRFHGEGSVQNWTWRIEMRDAFNNTKNSALKTLRLDKWPIHSVSAAWIVRPGNVDDGAAFNYSDNDPISYIVRVYQNWTGVGNQPNVTTNLRMSIDPPNASRIDLSDGWVNLTDCKSELPELKDDENLGGVGEEVDPTICNPTDDFFSNFKNTVHRASGKPGKWGVNIGILDVSGETRWINRTLYLLDKPPEVVKQEVLDANWTAVTAVNATQPLWINANFSDDRPEAMKAHANFTRTDGKSVNVTLTPRGMSSITDAEGKTTYYHVFNESVETGIGKTLGIAGTFNLTLAVNDSTGNWINTAPVVFKVHDNRDPRLYDAKVKPSVQEVNQNVVFQAYGWDETDMRMVVSLFSGGGAELMPPVTVLPSKEDPLNFTWSTNFSVEGNYAWTIALLDSEGRAATRTGTLAIRDNLGPRFEVLSPSATVGSSLYGPALPRIEIVASDSDTVDENSIVMVVDGQPVVPQIGAPPSGVNGILLSHQVPTARRFAHGDVVHVNVTASDGSGKRLEGWLNFSFVVDAIAPSASYASFEPRHRAASNHVWNVSLATQFRLAAADDDGLPTGVAAIRYVIRAGAASSGETLYNAPFTIDDAPGVYRGPTLYTLEIAAEDVVGNVNGTPVTMQVWVDDAAPDLVQFFPQDRYVNATFVDDQTGVQRAAVWHRVNAEPYELLELQSSGNNLWKGVLPEARRGDRVSYYLQAWDHLNNTQTYGNASEPKVSFSATNHAPSVRVTSPVTGSRVSGTFDLQWSAEDGDQDALTFLVSYRAPGKSGFTELAKLDAADARRYPVDSRRFQDGEYAFRVQADDGSNVQESVVTLKVINRADAIVGVSPITGTVNAGGTVLLKAEIAKAEAIVEARLYRNGELAGTYAMNDEGREGDEVANDGVYSVRAPIDASGDYSVEIFTRYEEDGEVKSSSMRDAVTFSAQLTPAYVMKEYGVLLVLIALVAAVAIGLGAWAVTRKKG